VAQKTGTVSRRAEYAEVTRRAIIAAARELFAERGYTATKVDEVAALARVSPATVYAVAGGKQGLLHTLVDDWTQAPEVDEAYRAIEASDTAEGVLGLVAATCRQMRCDWGDVMKIVLATAPLDETAAATLRTATDRYRAGTLLAARRLADLGALKPGLRIDDANDMLWFYFGYSGFFTLMEDNAWSADRAEEWLREMAAIAVLGSHDGQVPRGRKVG
jgi:AcrR family transcriptional regulator